MWFSSRDAILLMFLLCFFVQGDRVFLSYKYIYIKHQFVSCHIPVLIWLEKNLKNNWTWWTQGMWKSLIDWNWENIENMKRSYRMSILIFSVLSLSSRLTQIYLPRTLLKLRRTPVSHVPDTDKYMTRVFTRHSQDTSHRNATDTP